MSVVALVGSVLSLFLPETLGAPFVENVEDVKQLKASSKPFFAVWSAATLQRHLEANIRRKAETAQGWIVIWVLKIKFQNWLNLCLKLLIILSIQLSSYFVCIVVAESAICLVKDNYMNLNKCGPCVSFVEMYKKNAHYNRLQTTSNVTLKCVFKFQVHFMRWKLFHF